MASAAPGGCGDRCCRCWSAGTRGSRRRCQAARAAGIAGRRWAGGLLPATQVDHPDRVDPAEFAASIRAMKNSPVVVPLLRVITKRPLAHLPEDPDCPIRVVWAERDRII